MHSCCRSFIILIVLLIAQTKFSSAQNYLLKGHIISTRNNIPISYATVALFKATDSSLIKTTLTDSAGAFQFNNISTNSYFIRVSHLLYNDTAVVLDKRALVSHKPLI